MKNTFGNAVSITLFGESHGPSVGCILDGLAPGLPVDEAYIAELLTRRRPSGVISTLRREADKFVIESGVFNGKTTGTPICIRIPNEDTRSDDYNRLARPGHADYTANCKYHGYEDYRGGGHFSGRVTAALVAAAGILLPALEKKGIQIQTNIHRLAGIAGDGTIQITTEMEEKILSAKENDDSVGGILETTVIGLPSGVGEPWFDSVEGMLSHALFSIPAVKGVAFGDGFRLADMLGSEANDAFAITPTGVVTTTNHNGGINGGITNGMPLVFRCAIKPTPTIATPQKTIDLVSGAPVELQAKGRHDPCIVQRAAVVVDAITAITLCDLLTTRFGTDWLGEI